MNSASPAIAPVASNGRVVPRPLTVNADNIPAQLRDLRQWCLWKFERRNGDKPTKIPYQPNGRRAQSNNPETWTTLADVLKVAQKFDGIGVMFANGLAGLDLDGHVGADGKLSETARNLIARLASYAELSPSGSGIHVLFTGTLPSGKRKNLEHGLELYDSSAGRFFTVTGRRLEGAPGDVMPREDVARQIHAEMFSEPVPAHAWDAQRVTLAEMLATEPPPTRWLVSGVLEAQSLAVVYGKSGSLKSMLIADMALCVASERAWLTSPDGVKDVAPHSVQPAGVVWVNLDNGAAITHRRFSALAKARRITDAPITVYNFPALDLTLPGSVVEFRDAILAARAGLVVVDTFINAANVRNENDNAELRVPMFALRQLIETTGATIVLIHHPSKMGVANDSHDDLRGGSAIIGAVDTALRVVRPDSKSDSITITATKCRNEPVVPLAALWTYERDGCTNDLTAGAFFGVRAESATEKAADELQGRILTALTDGPMNTTALVAKVRADKSRVLVALRELGQRVQVETGPRGAKIYSLANR